MHKAREIRSAMKWLGASSRLAAAIAAVLLGACTTTPPTPTTPSPTPPTAPTLPAPRAEPEARYEAVAPSALPPIADADLRAAWTAGLKSCQVFERRKNTDWQSFCREAGRISLTDTAAQRALIGAQLQAWQVVAVTRSGTADGSARETTTSTQGRITGYYEPQLAGSRNRSPAYRYPLYRVPDDLLAVDLSSLYPELAGKRVRGRLEGKRVVPYWSRAELEGSAAPRGRELLWVADQIEAFFLQIQGSGRIKLPDGGVVRVGFADTNGRAYRSIGAVLVERGEMKAEEASMQSIQAWARAHPDRVTDLLNANPSYVFFRELPLGDPDAGPVGAFNVALTPGYSMAVDPRFIPLGSPVLVRTTDPRTNGPLVRLMLAQDTGGAIRGPLRFDFFWGFGAAAGAIAGRQRGEGQAWLLLPKGVQPELPPS